MNMGAKSHRLSKPEKQFLIGLFFLSLFLRVIYLLQSQSSPFFYNLTLDPLYHDLWGGLIASGDWLGQGVFFRAPLYAYFLGVIYSLFGHSLVLVKMIQHVIGSVSVVFIYMLARRMFDRRVSILAAILASVYWVLIYFEGELLLDSLLVFFSLLLFLLLYRAAEKHKYWLWVASGLVLGLAAITRPTILILAPVILVWLYIQFQRHNAFRAALKVWLGVMLGALLVIAPVAVRNYLLGNDFVLIASQGGINFFIGNNPHADGSSAVVPGLGDDWDYADAVFLAERELGKKLKPSQASNYFYKRGWDFILKQPGQSLPLLWKKFTLFWTKFEISNNQNIYFLQGYSSLLKILPFGFWLLGPLSILGLFLIARDFRKHSLLFLFIIFYMLTIVFFFVNARFRLPLLPFLTILAASSFFFIWDGLKIKEYRRVIPAGLSLILFFWFCNSNPYQLSKTNFSQSYFTLGNIYLRQDIREKAKVYYDSALTLNPNLPRAHLNLGLIHLGKGELDSAGAAFARVLAINPYEEKALNNLSAVYRLKGEYQKSVQFARAAAELRPNYIFAYSNLSQAYLGLHQPDSAVLALKEGLANSPHSLQLKYYLAEHFLKQNQPGEAEGLLEDILLGKTPVDIQTYDISGFWQNQSQAEARLKYLSAYHLGLIWANRNDLVRAEQFFRLASQIQPNLPEAIANLGKVAELQGRYSQAVDFYTRAIQIDPDNAVFFYNRAVNHLKAGDTSSTQADLLRSLSLDPNFEPARQVLESLGK